MQNKKMTTCPHCGKVVKKGNFCNKCGKKLANMCDCWLMKRPYHCSFQKCPDMSDFTLLLLHIQQDQKRRKYVVTAVEKIGASSCERINLLLEVDCLADSNKQNVVTVAADSGIADKSQGGIGI